MIKSRSFENFRPIAYLLQILYAVRHTFIHINPFYTGFGKSITTPVLLLVSIQFHSSLNHVIMSKLSSKHYSFMQDNKLTLQQKQELFLFIKPLLMV